MSSSWALASRTSSYLLKKGTGKATASSDSNLGGLILILGDANQEKLETPVWRDMVMIG